MSKNHIITTPFTTTTELAICLRDDLYRWFDRQRADEMARVAAGDIVTTRDDHRSVRLQIGAAEGCLVYDVATQPRPRPTPVRPSVRPFRGLLDRAAESEAALKTMPELAPVEFYGQSGIGKTALLRHLAYNTPDGHFPDGMVYRDQAGSQPAADLLHSSSIRFTRAGAITSRARLKYSTCYATSARSCCWTMSICRAPRSNGR